MSLEKDPGNEAFYARLSKPGSPAREWRRYMLLNVRSRVDYDNRMWALEQRSRPLDERYQRYMSVDNGLEVRCPTCHAPAEVACSSRGGRRLSHPHVSRVRASVRAGQPS